MYSIYTILGQVDPVRPQVPREVRQDTMENPQLPPQNNIHQNATHHRAGRQDIVRNYVCPECNRDYTTKGSLVRHQKTHQPPTLLCPFCPSVYHRTEHLKNHVAKHLILQ